MDTQKKQKQWVYIYKIDFPDDPPKKVFLPPKFNQLLNVATDALDLPRHAEQIFDADRKRITTLEEIQPKSKLFISCTKPPIEVEDEPLYKTRIPQYTKRQFVTVKQPEIKPIRQDARMHQIIASSQKSVKESVRDALLALYNSLTPEHKAQLTCSESLKQLTDDTTQYLLENYIITQFIGPTSDIVKTEIGKQTYSWCIEKMKGLKVDDIKLLITGPERSGKSTILNFLSSIAIQKLIISGDIKNYLVCAINWYQYQSYAGDLTKLFDIFLEATLEGVKASHMEFMPVLPTLQQWLIAARTNPSLPMLPPVLQNFPGFPYKDIQRLGQRINQTYNKKDKMKQFITECVELPFRISQCFGFRSVLHVFDHFDLTGYIIQPSGHFSSSEEQVLLSEQICQVFETCPFIAASLNDNDLFKVFTVNKYRNFTTERIITSDDSQQKIAVKDPVLTLTYDMCRGCPAYCAMYNRIVELAQSEIDNRIVKQSYHKIESSIDFTRRVMVKQELGRLFSLLLQDDEGNSKSLNAAEINRLLSMDEVFVELQ